MMRIVLFLSAASLVAQTPPARTALKPFQPGYNELKSALNLTDQQVEQLTKVHEDRQLAAQAVYQGIGEKQKQLNDMLNAGSSDAMAIGNLNIEIQKLRKQGAPPPPSREQMLAILTPEQQAQLTKLQEALRLRAAADQAAALNLIAYPYVDHKIMPMAVK